MNEKDTQVFTATGSWSAPPGGGSWEAARRALAEVELTVGGPAKGRVSVRMPYQYAPRMTDKERDEQALRYRQLTCKHSMVRGLAYEVPRCVRCGISPAELEELTLTQVTSYNGLQP
jgi:hypothetical protein